MIISNFRVNFPVPEHFVCPGKKQRAKIELIHFWSTNDVWSITSVHILLTQITRIFKPLGL